MQNKNYVLWLNHFVLNQTFGILVRVACKNVLAEDLEGGLFLLALIFGALLALDSFVILGALRVLSLAGLLGLFVGSRKETPYTMTKVDSYKT